MTENNIITLPNGLDALVFDGVPRVLAKLPPNPRQRACGTALSAAVPMVDPSKYREINHRTDLGDQFVLDQRSHGSCVGFSSTSALMKTRVMQGMTFQRLSGAFVYSLINGGQDNGAMIHDSIQAVTDIGSCLESEAGWDAIYPNRYPPSAKETARRFRYAKSYVVNTWKEAMTAVQLGFVLELAVMVGSRFTTLNGDGVAGFDPGPGNHAVHADGCHRLSSGEWVLDMGNTWGLGFGTRGRCYLTQRHFESVQQDSYAVLGATDDPLDPNNPPPIQP